MLAMVRMPLVIDNANKIRVTRITELVQIRVYKRIPVARDANMHGDFGEQDVCEFILDRAKLAAGEHGLRAVGKTDIGEVFARDQDPLTSGFSNTPALKSCIMCHQTPGIDSVFTIKNGLRSTERYTEFFRTYDFPVELNYTVVNKTHEFGWGLLQGMLEAQRTR
jgi:hypothetical protein